MYKNIYIAHSFCRSFCSVYCLLYLYILLLANKRDSDSDVFSPQAGSHAVFTEVVSPNTHVDPNVYSNTQKPRD